MPTKGKRAKLSDVRQGKTFYTINVWQEWDFKTKTNKGPKKIEIEALFLNGKKRIEDDYIFIGTNQGDHLFCYKHGIINEKTCSTFTTRNAAIKYAKQFQ